MLEAFGLHVSAVWLNQGLLSSTTIFQLLTTLSLGFDYSEVVEGAYSRRCLSHRANPLSLLLGPRQSTSEVRSSKSTTLSIHE
jgi:hypothetical protein